VIRPPDRDRAAGRHSNEELTMGFQRFSARPQKKELVVSVGSRAYINWQPPTGDVGRGVPMLNGAGIQLDNNLNDGEEVEILSWRPRSRLGVTYQIRRIADRSEWWVAATYLRRSQTASAASGSGEPAGDR
jgi:hypothetical protein